VIGIKAGEVYRVIKPFYARIDDKDVLVTRGQRLYVTYRNLYGVVRLESPRGGFSEVESGLWEYMDRC
jgi:hypothetical protein